MNELNAASIPPSTNAQKRTKMQTMIVEPTSSSRLGHVTFFNSALTSCKKDTILFIALISVRWACYGRPGGIRTPNPRIWSPPLYQLELLAYFRLFILFLCAQRACGIWRKIYSIQACHSLFF